MTNFERGSTPIIVDDINVGVLLHTLGFQQQRKATARKKLNGKLEWHFHFESGSIDGLYGRDDVVAKWYDTEWLNDPANAGHDIVKAKFANVSKNQFLDQIKGDDTVEYCFLHNQKIYRDEMDEGGRVLTEVHFGESYGFVDADGTTYEKFDL